MGRSTVGLVLRPTSVEVVEATQGMRGISVTKSNRVSLMGSDDAQVIQAIRWALERAGVTAKRVVVSIPAQDVLLRFFTLPQVPRAEWETSVQFEARKYIPFKTDDLIWDYSVIQQPAEKQLHAVFAAIERSAFNKIQGLLAGAGVNPIQIEPHCFSLARAINVSRQVQPKSFVAAVEIEGQVAHVAVVRDGVAYLTRQVALASEANTKEAERQSEHEAQAEHILSELRLSMDFFARECTGAQVERVLVFSDESSVGDWCSKLASNLACPVEAGKLPHGLARGQGGISASFAASLGAALAEKKATATTINFVQRSSITDVSKESAPSRATATLSQVMGVFAELNKLALGACAATMAVLLGLLWLAGSRDVVAARQKFASAVENRIEVGWDLSGRSHEELEALKLKLDAQRDFLLQAVGHRVEISPKLDALARTLPEGIWLNSVVYDNQSYAGGQNRRSLTVRGACYLGKRSEEFTAIQQFEDEMKKQPNFFDDFNSSYLKEITAKQSSYEDDTFTYRTFTMDYDSERTIR